MSWWWWWSRKLLSQNITWRCSQPIIIVQCYYLILFIICLKDRYFTLTSWHKLQPAKYGEFPFIATLEIRSNFGYYNLVRSLIMVGVDTMMVTVIRIMMATTVMLVEYKLYIRTLILNHQLNLGITFSLNNFWYNI